MSERNGLALSRDVAARPKTLKARFFTTGAVANLCGVAPRTAVKWIDKGLIEGGFCVPGTKDRRVPRWAVANFLRKYGYAPIDDLPPAVVFGDAPPLPGLGVVACTNLFDFAVAAFGADVPVMAVVDRGHCPRADAAVAVARLSKHPASPLVVVVKTADGDADDWHAVGASVVLSPPVRPDVWAELAARAAGRKEV